MIETCANCRYFLPHEEDQNGIGLCRRYPANTTTISVIKTANAFQQAGGAKILQTGEMQISRIEFGGEIQILTEFPRMTPAGWCGEWAKMTLA